MFTQKLNLKITVHKITIYCSFIDYHRNPLGAEVDRILDEELIKDESSLGIELFVLQNDRFLEFNHESRSVVPMGADFGGEIASV